MRSSQIFGAHPVTKSIVNAYSTSGAANILLTAAQASPTAKAALSGTLTANTLATMLSITGAAGFLDMFAVTSVDATSRTHRVKITLDGTVAFDNTASAAATVENTGIIPVGAVSNNTTTKTLLPDPQFFRTSCLVEYASSVSETDKTNVYYAYRTTN